MMVIVINLRQATERHAFQERQLKRLGVDFEWLWATSVDQIDEHEKSQLAQLWERPLMLTEVACFLSHQRAWARVVALNRPCLILEDDACLSFRLPKFLALAEGLQGVDHLNLEIHQKAKWLGPTRELSDGLGVARLYQDRAGAAAYILWPTGARCLVDKAKSGQAALADAFIANERSWVSLQADPVMAMQAEVLHWRGMPTSLTTSSCIQANQAVSVATGKTWRYRRRRLRGQLGIAWRKLSTVFVAQQREPLIVAADFNDRRDHP
jgi:glycosyl transferase family 25